MSLWLVHVNVFWCAVCPQVNEVSVDGKQHADVVAAIKAGGDNTTLLVVDPETDAFFKKCRVAPTAEHLTGTSYTKHEVRFPAAVTLHGIPLGGVWQGHSGKRVSVSRCAGFGFPIKQFSLSVLFCYPVPTVCNSAKCIHGNCVFVCVCVFDTTRLVMSEWRHNVSSFYLPSKLLASALVETLLSYYHCYYVLSVWVNICLRKNGRIDQMKAFRRLMCCCSQRGSFNTHNQSVFCQNHCVSIWIALFCSQWGCGISCQQGQKTGSTS